MKDPHPNCASDHPSPRGGEAAESAIPISGIFRAGDSESFAQAVAKTYALQLGNESNEIVLAAVN